MDDKKLELRSEQVQDLLGQIPAWLTRWGSLLALLVLAVILTGSWFFKYPEIINSKIIVTTTDPPASIIAKSTGKIVEIFIKDKQKVKKGDFLAVVDNPALFSDVITLKSKLDSLKSLIYNNKSDSFIILKESFSLGELQQSYMLFLKSYDDYLNFVDLDYHKSLIGSLNEQIVNFNIYIGQMIRQKKVLQEEVIIAMKQLERNKTLLEKDIISKSVYEKSESELLTKKYAVEQSESDLASTRMKLQEVEQRILDLKLTSRDDKSKMESSLIQVYENLRSEIQQWIQTYVLISPVDGVLTMTKIWSANQNVTTGENVFTVIPSDQVKIIGKLVLPVQGSGKVKEGQKVNIKFDNYPYMEYGIVSGIILSISMIPSDNHYIVEVELPDGLKTSYKKNLQFSQEMTGNAEVITEEIRLFNRLFNPLKSVIRER